MMHSNKFGLKYAVDGLPLTVIAVCFVLSILPVFWGLNVWLLIPYWLLVTALKNATLSAQHNHAHLSMFHHPVANFVLDIVLAQTTGYSTPEWELQHNRGHHRNYLNPREDLTSPVNEHTGETVGIWSFVWQGSWRGFGEAWGIAKEAQLRGKPEFLKRLKQHVGIQVALTALWVWLNPVMGLLFFVYSNVIARALIWWGSYWHHLNAPCTNLYDASNTCTSHFLNAISFNNGYHTVHHEQPALHWSLLPQRTEQVSHLIPAQCISPDPMHF